MLTSARSSNQWLEFWTGGCGFELFVGERACVCICDALRRSTFYKDSAVRLNASEFFVTSWWSLSQSRNYTPLIELKHSFTSLLFSPYSHLSFSVRSFNFFLLFHYSCFIFFSLTLFLYFFLFFVPYFLLSSFYSLSVLLAFFLSTFLTFIRTVFLKKMFIARSSHIDRLSKGTIPVNDEMVSVKETVHGGLL